MFSQGIVIALLQFPLIAAGFPMADTLLNSVDNALGFDWNRFAARFNSPLPLDLLAFAYRSMTWQALLALALLSIGREIDRAWRLVTASLVALMITASIFVFFPADGSLALCGQSDVPVYGNYCAYQSLIRQVNSGAVVAVDRSMQIGMVSFPSFHTSAAILLAWAVWPFRLLRWPSVALNIAMIVGTIVIGSHYLIDILGGIAVAIAAIALAKRWV
ncbi:phosphatase PAP2 family protein [Sphingomonas sp. LY160]|uniref:phosphatase PAP2 family protein n=1 Tax=Sphingomonas sp. LY160 TaxID=3095342 RepID=UPI002ADEF1BB|nr:phosphatase PAP2 family protein [Sphingomonas sp. LY160]MEA1073271.1 phosphatase PAP2 family protein [Sphingomonas sp. LY160]